MRLVLLLRLLCRPPPLSHVIGRRGISGLFWAVGIKRVILGKAELFIYNIHRLISLPARVTLFCARLNRSTTCAVHNVVAVEASRWHQNKYDRCVSLALLEMRFFTFSLLEGPCRKDTKKNLFSPCALVSLYLSKRFYLVLNSRQALAQALACLRFCGGLDKVFALALIA